MIYDCIGAACAEEERERSTNVDKLDNRHSREGRPYEPYTSRSNLLTSGKTSLHIVNSYTNANILPTRYGCRGAMCLATVDAGTLVHGLYAGARWC